MYIYCIWDKKKYSFEGRAAKEEMMKSHLPNKVPC